MLKDDQDDCLCGSNDYYTSVMILRMRLGLLQWYELVCRLLAGEETVILNKDGARWCCDSSILQRRDPNT